MPWNTALVLKMHQYDTRCATGPSWRRLPDERVLLIISHLHDIGRGNVISLALVSRFFYPRARYVLYRNVRINLNKSQDDIVEDLTKLSLEGWLPAVRSLSFRHRRGLKRRRLRRAAAIPWSRITCSAR
jgi:hypothetical protein